MEGVKKGRDGGGQNRGVGTGEGVLGKNGVGAGGGLNDSVIACLCCTSKRSRFLLYFCMSAANLAFTAAANAAAPSPSSSCQQQILPVLQGKEQQHLHTFLHARN